MKLDYQRSSGTISAGTECFHQLKYLLKSWEEYVFVYHLCRTTHKSNLLLQVLSKHACKMGLAIQIGFQSQTEMDLELQDATPG